MVARSLFVTMKIKERSTNAEIWKLMLMTKPKLAIFALMKTKEQQLRILILGNRNSIVGRKKTHLPVQKILKNWKKEKCRGTTLNVGREREEIVMR